MFMGHDLALSMALAVGFLFRWSCFILAFAQSISAQVSWKRGVD
jgi:hypothetical protein